MYPDATGCTPDPSKLKQGIADAEAAKASDSEDGSLGHLMEFAERAYHLSGVNAVEFTEECGTYSHRYRIEFN